MDKPTDLFVKALLSAIGHKLVALLRIGSREKLDETAFSDTDLILLGTDLDRESLRSIRHIVRNLDCLVDMPVIQKSELPSNPDSFQMGTHGCYFVRILKQSRVIYGTNFFSTYPEPSRAAIRASIFRKIAEYTWSARRSYIESNRERTIAQNYQLNSRIVKMVKDILWLQDFADAYQYTGQQAITALQLDKRVILSRSDLDVLNLITDPRKRNSLASNMSEDFLENRIALIEVLYAHAVTILEGRL
jgi:hypothetical protein